MLYKVPLLLRNKCDLERIKPIPENAIETIARLIVFCPFIRNLLAINIVLFLVTSLSTLTAFAEDKEQIYTPKHAQNLSELPKLFKNRYGLDRFRGEMSDIQDTDRLGTHLPSGLKNSDILRLIAPNEDTSLAIAVGAKAFPYRQNSYVVIACFARSKEKYNREIPYSEKSCKKKTYDRDDAVYLGLIEYASQKQTNPKLIARSFEIEMGWNFIISEQFRSSKHKDNSLLPNGNYKEFDFAPFKVSDTQTAFGLRSSQVDGYAGGYGYFEVLSLFIVDGDRIVNIFAEPIYFHQNIAGDWNKDGTRQHALYEAENVLVVLPSKTGKYYDLQIKSMDSEWQRVFSWDDSQQRYLPDDTPKTSTQIPSILAKTAFHLKNSTFEIIQGIQKVVRFNSF